ncbi:GNAT family N-acetyltransferase [Enterovirga rhinocerotis]|uniref:Putative acetyltransferase n=1 Tax=Enterovirga rhinocerotis TaxID=1339210 RepID=A0A4R7CB79_9HYPH|nr:GNAT family N-acetyltransferase [Enterovirga rhinocerotis]TDR94007.1 putative acetyltransferase [Enterovirga rhinocerotis]
MIGGPPAGDLVFAPPCPEWLGDYADALRRGWSPNNLRDVGSEQLAAIAADPEAFLASLTAQSGTIRLADGQEVPRLPNRVLWLWDGAFCGVIGLRWQDGTDALPPYVTGHVGYAIVPWKRRRGYATAALRTILPVAREVGLTEIEITADSTNTASLRIIEKCGGRLAGERGKGHAPGSRHLVYRIPT